MNECEYEKAVRCLVQLFIKAEIYAIGEIKDKKKLKERVIDFVESEFEKALKIAKKKVEEERRRRKF